MGDDERNAIAAELTTAPPTELQVEQLARYGHTPRMGMTRSDVAHWLRALANRKPLCRARSGGGAK